MKTVNQAFDIVINLNESIVLRLILVAGTNSDGLISFHALCYGVVLQIMGEKPTGDVIYEKLLEKFLLYCIASGCERCNEKFLFSWERWDYLYNVFVEIMLI